MKTEGEKKEFSCDRISAHFPDKPLPACCEFCHDSSVEEEKKKHFFVIFFDEEIRLCCHMTHWFDQEERRQKKEFALKIKEKGGAVNHSEAMK